MTNTAARRKVAEAIRSERARRKWSQAVVAQKADVSPRRIVELENETSDPRFSTLEKVAGVLGLTVTVEAA